LLAVAIAVQYLALRKSAKRVERTITPSWPQNSLKVVLSNIHSEKI